MAELYPEDNCKYSSFRAMGKRIRVKGFKWKERAEGGVDLIKERTEGSRDMSKRETMGKCGT